MFAFLGFALGSVTTEKVKQSSFHALVCYQLRNNTGIAPENKRGISRETSCTKHMEEARYLEVAAKVRGTLERDRSNTTCVCLIAQHVPELFHPFRHTWQRIAHAETGMLKFVFRNHKRFPLECDPPMCYACASTSTCCAFQEQFVWSSTRPCNVGQNPFNVNSLEDMPPLRMAAPLQPGTCSQKRTKCNPKTQERPLSHFTVSYARMHTPHSSHRINTRIPNYPRIHNILTLTCCSCSSSCCCCSSSRGCRLLGAWLLATIVLQLLAVHDDRIVAAT